MLNNTHKQVASHPNIKIQATTGNNISVVNPITHESRLQNSTAFILCNKKIVFIISKNKRCHPERSAAESKDLHFHR